MRILLAVLALTLCTGILHAANSYLSLSVPSTQSGTATTIPLTCNPVSGLGSSVSVIVGYSGSTALSSSTTMTVALSSVAVTLNSSGTPTTTTYTGTTGTTALTNSPVTVTAPSSQVLTSSSGTLTYTISLKSTVFASATGCSGLSTTQPTTNAVITFTSKLGSATAAADTAQPAVIVTQTAPLSVSPTSATVYCTYDGTTYSSVFPPTISVSATSTTGVAIASETTSNTWLHVATAAGTATSSTPLTFTANAVSPCASLTQGKTTTGSMSVNPTLAYYSPVSIPVTLKVVYASPLNPVSTVSMSYRKGSSAVTAKAVISSSQTPSPYFTVDTTTLPSYFTVDAFNGTASSTGKTITFTSTSVADSLPPGTYTQVVHFQVSSCADLAVTVSFTVSNALATLSTSEGTTRNFTWSVGNSLPTAVITAVSSDSPISYTAVASTGGVVSSLSPSTGLAYSWGSQITVNFDALAFQSAQPGNTLTGTVTLTGNSSTITITFTVVVNSATSTASLTAISPSTLPTSTAGQQYTVYLYGAGFVSSTESTQKTYVGVASSIASSGSTTLVTDSNIVVSVVNSSTIALTITVPSTTDSYLPFSAGGTTYIGVCNPGGSSCSTAASTAIKALKIGSGPVISSITSASSFIQSSTTPTVAPYDMISIFGSNFCTSGGTGCSSTQVLLATPSTDGLLTYPTTLSPDNGTRNLTVKFYANPYSSTSTAIATAPLLFATNSQINALVPGGPSAISSLVSAGGKADIVVWFGTVASSAYTVTFASSNPGIFTVGSDGAGDGAILAAGDYSLISNSNPAVVKPSGSDTVLVYGTGLGVPSNTSDSRCITLAAYLTALQGISSSVTYVDGAVMQSSLLGGLTAPCVTPSAMSLGAISATPDWEGWVSGAIAGLYQMNVTLPSNTYAATPAAGTNFTDSTSTVLSQIIAPAQVPIWVGSPSSPLSQSGVYLWVQPGVSISVPSGCSTSEAGGSTAFTCDPVASDGTGATPAYTYSLETSAAFLVMADASTGAITSTDPVGAEASYMVNVVAKDGTNPDTVKPARGSFNLYVPPATGTSLHLLGTTPVASVYGTANTAVTTVSVSGGCTTCTYSLTSPPTGVAINSTTGVVSTTALTPPGTAHITVAATDNQSSATTGTLYFDLPVALAVSSSNGSSVSGSTGTANSSITTFSASGATGTVTYTLVAGPSWAALSGSTLTTTSSATTGIYSVRVKAVDSGTSATGYINLSLHIN